ncbi:non-ribosomal peptide synthetase/type I polyketide synthase [Burkholderia cenocepacia]|uniref:non-ribosomal peptide synthetase/type I polyketide synthase n=2 Tax=Burkholderia cenocepacia TaxID=95486 RepID=UPI00223297FB|nr:non-ribosomal peptide synthetase/type I polyketide synthase [Burkholderia cenocepacia]MCW3610637.1 amino acid adenylation domain-containing protein [Burkholderia cenocepacia]MCW5191703.1 amino acid adenylation domain-containing protein [Burkholderia cenocepacia]
MDLASLAETSVQSIAAGTTGMSAAQQSLWFLNQFERGGVTYNVPFSLRLSGRVDAEALARAFDVVQRRHPALRCRFPARGGQPVAQVVETTAALTRVDFSHLPDPEASVAELESEQARASFDLEHDAPLRATLARVADDDYRLVATVHHIVFDGRSLQLFLDELARAYAELADGREPDVAPLDDGLHSGPDVAPADLAAGLAHWQARLSGAPAVLPLPLDQPRPAARRFNGRRIEFDVPRDVADALREVARVRSLSMYMVGLTAFAVLLRRYTHEGDVVIGSPISNRYAIERDDAIGYFVNTLPNRIDVSGTPTFSDVLERVRTTVLDTLEHADVPFEKIVEAVQPPRSLGHAPIFQVLFDLSAEGFDVAFGPGIDARMHTLDSCTAKYDLSLTLALADGSMRGAFEYDCDLLDGELVERMSDSLERILRCLAADPDARIDAAPLLSRDAAAAMLALANDGAREQDRPFVPFHRAFEQAARRDGGALALVYGDRRATYADVDAHATALAVQLHAAGVRRGDRVVVLRRYGPDVIVALLAIHKAGAVFVPVSPDDARHDALIADVAPAALVVEFPCDGAGFDCTAIAMDALAVEPGAPLDGIELDGAKSTADDIAYVIFTSGSTGRPKGVEVSHGSWISLFHAFEAAYGHTKPGVTAVLQMANHTFDVFMSDVIRGLGGGGRLIMCPRESLTDAQALHALIESERATVMEFVPAVVRQMIDYLERSGKRLDGVQAVTCGADVWFVHEYRKLRALCAPDTRVLSVYGVTEATCESAIFEPRGAWTDAERSMPIGTPLPNTSMYVIDGALNLVPLGVPGELLIGGGAVASGYLNRPELTRERFPVGAFDADGRFVSDPGGRRFYRTGDLCRHLADGTIEFIGRLDNQVKVRGFRIELGEIESVLADHPAVRECAVVTREAPGGELELVGYAAATSTRAALLDHLRARLPEHMVPRALVLMPALPLSANGKIDRKRLPAPDWDEIAHTYVAPRNPLEARLAQDWETLLRTSRIGVHDNFFERGGHSLLVTQALTRIQDAFGVTLKVADVFERPTIGQLAERVMEQMMSAARQGGAARAAASIPRADGPERTRLSFAQRRMWFARQAEPGAAYNMPEVFRVRGPLDRDALEAALNRVIGRHEVLRTRFTADVRTWVDDAGQPRREPLAQIDGPAPVALVVEAVEPARVNERLAREAARPFELDREWPIRALLLSVAPDEHVLCIVLHHIAYDGWSSGLLRRELAHAYRACAAGEALTPGAPAVQYQDYAAWQRARTATGEFAESVAAWRERLRDLPPALPLPERTDAPGAGAPGADDVDFTLPASCASQLKRLCERLNCTPTMVMHAALAVLLHRYTGQDDILIGIPFAGRDHPDAESLMGFFVNLLPVRLQIDAQMRLADAIGASRRALLEAESGQSVPLDHLVETLNPARAPGRHPFFQIGLVVQSAAPEALDLAGLAVDELAVASGDVKLDLMLEVRAYDGAPLGGRFKYRTSRYSRAFVDGLTRHFGELLRNLLADADQRVPDVMILPADEYVALTDACRATRRDFGALGDVIAQLEAHAAATPDAIALEFDARRWTYAQLDQLANRIAAALRAHGAMPGTHVGLFTGRHPYLVAGMLGALKARCAFVPLNPDDTVEGGLGYTVADAGVRLVVAQRDLASRCAALGVTTLIADDIDDDQAPAERAPGLVHAPTDLAYVLYTSGSTGRPKGVMVTRRNLLNTAHAFAACVGLHPGARQLQYFSPVFDGVCGEVFPVLVAGATLVFAHAARLLPGPELLELLRAARITHLQITPTALRLLPHADLPELATIVAAGEACPANVAREWAQGRRFINGYGPTETTIYASATDYWDARGALVLRPIANVTFEVLDRYGHPLPSGVPGELYIGGEGVAAGYLNLDEATARSFVHDPHSTEPGARRYRTGDYVIRQPDGSLTYVGRADAQVKIRGFRVEPGEVEARLNALPGITQAVVVTPYDANGRRILVGYYVGEPAEGEVRTRLAQQLPAHLVPERLVQLLDLPRARTGKVDRNALAARAVEPPAADAGEPAGTVAAAPAPAAVPGERVPTGGRRLLAHVKAIWQAVLERDDIEPESNFFDLGGHSLRIVEMRKRLEDAFATRIAIADLFEHPTLRALVAHLERNRVCVAEPDETPAPTASGAPDAPDAVAPASDHAIAVIGMAGRFCGAPDVQAFWDNLLDGVESTLHFSDELLAEHGADAPTRAQPDFVRLGNRLEDAEAFDAEFFGYSAREAALMDPQQRLFLECAWAAAEAAGYGAARGARVGVFASAGTSHYLLDNVYPRRRELKLENIQWLLGNGRDFLATRVAYKLDLAGPAVSVETACSSSLVAVHAACASLRAGDCEMALVGGVSLEAEYYGYRPMPDSIISTDGRCRPFDADASGTTGGSGCAVVMLKPLAKALEDGDHVHAVIRGSAINNDGAGKVSYTAPSVAGQADVIAAALRDADVPAHTIGYVEAHGTGTRLGDPVEFRALTQAYAPNGAWPDGRRCALGSLKANLGHLDAAAGIVGFVKAVLAVEHGALPPMPHFTKPNPEIDLDGSPFHVNTERCAWPDAPWPRRAGVSSFGIGGTNAHVIVEAPPSRPSPDATDDGVQVLPLSARTPAALRRMRRRLAAHLRTSSARLSDVALSLGAGRARLPVRDTIVCETREAACAALDAPWDAPAREPREDRPVVFMFPGQGAQHIGMLKGLHEREPAFRDALNECAALLRTRHGLDILEAMYPGPDRDDDAAARLRETDLAQPALFAVDYACAMLLRARGVEPDALIGHSLGELVAACVGGFYTLADALAIVAMRGRLMQAADRGAMLAVALDEHACARWLGADVELAAVNGRNQCVLAGGTDTIERLRHALAEAGVQSQPLATSHAFHSHRMAAAAQALEAFVARIPVQAGTVPVVSNRTGAWLSLDAGNHAGYWASHLRDTVRFADGIATLHDAFDAPLLVEVGPGRTLRTALDADGGTYDALGCGRHPRERTDDVSTFAHAFAALWRQGARIDWRRACGSAAARRVPLPTYPFARTRHWIDAPAERSGPPPLYRHWRRVAGGRRSYELAVSPSWWVVDEHRVFDGKPVLPGTGCLELVRGAFERMGHGPRIALSDVYFPAPLVLDDAHGARIVHVSFGGPDGDAQDFALVSAAADDAAVWTVHAQGTIADAAPTQAPPARFEHVRAQRADTLASTAAQAALAERLALFGPRWHCFRALWLADDEGVAQLELDPTFAADLAHTPLHPALLDMATGFLSTLENRGARLPFHYRRLSIHAPLTARLFSHARRVRENVFDVTLFALDEAGGVGPALVEVEGFTLRDERAGAAVDRSSPAAWCTRPAWRPALPPRGDALPEAAWTIVARAMPVRDTIAPHAPHGSMLVDDAARGAGAAGAGDAYGHAQAFERNPRPAQILYCVGADDRGSAAERFDDLMGLLQTFGPHVPSGTVLTLVTTGACAVRPGDRPNAAQAALVGALRAASREFAHLRCRHVDLPVEPGDADHAALRGLLARADAGAPVLLAPTLALRDGTFHEPCFRPVPDVDAAPALVDGGAYVITGGLGGMGLTFAAHIARRVAAPRLFLVSRTADASRPDVAAEIAALRALGADVTLVQADCGEPRSWAAALADIAARCGRIDGAIHAAGIEASGPIQLGGPVSWARVLAPKTLGTDALLDALRACRPDFVLLCSSLAALAGGLGQADYAAANAYLDAVAHAARHDGLPVVSVNWDAWAEVGMRVAYDRAHPNQTPIDAAHGLLNDDGCRVFDLALKYDGAQVAVCKAEDVEAWLRRVAGGPDPHGERGGARVSPSGDERIAPRNDVERELAQLWRELLGGELPGVTDDFFMLGGHSLLGAQLISRVRERFAHCLTLAEFLDEPTIERMAQSLGASDAADTVLGEDDAHVRYCLVPVQRTGAGTPFFCLPGMGGNVTQVLPLARAMGAARPFYGLQCLGLDGNAEPHGSVEAMAEHYVRCIRSVQSHGPYLLGGHSLGGKVALEMARRLDAEGEPPGLIALFDSAAPPYRRMTTPTDAQVVGSLLGIFGRYSGKPVDVTPEMLERLDAASHEERLRFLKTQLQAHGLIDARADDGSIGGIFNVYRAAAAFGMAYDPPKLPSDWSFVLFRAVDSMPAGINLPEIRQTPAWGWEAFSRAPVECIDVPGDHFTCLSEVHAHAIAVPLARRLEAFER